MAGLGRKAKKLDDAKISGMHIYIDKNGRSVYYNIFNHTGYVIDGYEKTYRSYSMRFLVGFLAAVLSYAFDFGILITCILGIGAWLFMEIRFRKFLKGMPKIQNFKPENKPTMFASMVKEDPKKLLMKGLLWLALGICVVINAYEKGYTDFMLMLNYFIAVVAVIVAVVYMMGLFKSRSISK